MSGETEYPSVDIASFGRPSFAIASRTALVRDAFSAPAAVAVVPRVCTAIITEARSGVTFTSPWPEDDTIGGLSEMFACPETAVEARTFASATARMVANRIGFSYLLLS